MNSQTQAHGELDALKEMKARNGANLAQLVY